ncbi:suppressor of lurcher protein 1 [Bactrocera neohumeralis]|uniref:suppressor of lurcher protein 1 n=1 Tax=Bactrocera neohumeralis TaxID=98809 RepID=UPI0021658CD7|nr:suppressor of lurcher protein 1 [Bactrocera neohumeralis]
MPPTTTGRFVRRALLLALLCAHICQGIAALLQKELWLECSCMYASERNATSWGNIAINGSTLRGAKNDCYLIFIAGGNDELVALRFQTLQLAAGCSEYIEIFPFLREPVIENSTNPDYVICNRTAATTSTVSALASATAATALAANRGVATTKALPSPTTAEIKQQAMSSVNANTMTMAQAASKKSVPAASGVANHAHLTVIAANNSVAAAVAVADLRGNEFIYSAGKIFGIRVRFNQQQLLQREQALGNEADGGVALKNWLLNITGEYRFLKKEHFQNDGRLIPGSYCDYYFFADPNAKPDSFEIWQYFHSPRFPAKYPAHIKCAYKFIGRPESRVEIVFEELQLPKKDDSCSMDKLIIFDSESANMNAVIDVICDAPPTRRIISSGPDLLIEFNASSNKTAKGFRGKFKFIHNEVEDQFMPALTNDLTTEKIIALERIGLRKETPRPVLTADEWGKFFKDNENCKQIFDSRVNKSGRFDTAQLFPTVPNVNIIPVLSPSRVQCRFEFYGGVDERVQIKFLDFHIPAENKNATECKANDVLQLLTQVRGKYEPTETFCGAFLPKPIMSNGPKLLLQFIGRYPPTGSKINYYGFKAEFKFVKNFGISTGQQLDENCTFTYNSTDRKSGWFGSPNFPGYYPQNMICHYYFYGEPDERVIIRFTFFDVEGIGTCEYLTASDYVEFSNFMSTDRKYGRYCGKRDKFEVRSDGRFFRVSFYSNDRFDKTGFRALYDYQGKSSRVENTSMQSYISGSTGILKSYYNLQNAFTLILFKLFANFKIIN